MKKYAFVILLIIIIVGVAGLMLASTTGQSYRYAQQFGPQGQPPSHVNNEFFSMYTWHRSVPFPSVQTFPTPSSKAACCSFVKLAEVNSVSCPSDVETFEYSCSDAEGAFVMPPCPPNHLFCNMPGE